MYRRAKILDRKKAVAQQIQAIEETLKTISSIALRVKLRSLKKEFEELGGIKKVNFMEQLREVWCWKKKSNYVSICIQYLQCNILKRKGTHQ
jgi:hypothetical protein